jgi:hypothetical protein
MQISTRWAERYRLAEVNVSRGQFYDWEQHLAEEGYLLIGARLRQTEEAATVLAILQKVFKKVVEPANLFSLHEQTSTVTRPLLQTLLRLATGFMPFIVADSNFSGRSVDIFASVNQTEEKLRYF